MSGRRRIHGQTAKTALRRAAMQCSAVQYSAVQFAVCRCSCSVCCRWATKAKQSNLGRQGKAKTGQRRGEAYEVRDCTEQKRTLKAKAKPRRGVLFWNGNAGKGADGR